MDMFVAKIRIDIITRIITHPKTNSYILLMFGYIVKF